MSDVDAWLRLIRLPGVGPKAVQKLLSHFGSAAIALDASVTEWERAGLSSRQTKAKREGTQPHIDQDLRWLEADHHFVLTIEDSMYPQQLRDIPDPPALLYVTGDPELLQTPQLAIVGSRNATRGGLSTAKAFSHHLAASGIGITSGLALGIDAAAHQGALEANGITIAVAGTGLDGIYPARNRQLGEQIARHGALVSEFPIGTRPSAENFPRRNRIISGLSLGTLVVEAAIKSGSLITARVASEQGREVFAIPGSIHNPLARGCHSMIRQGAKLVETADDILEELGPLLKLEISPPVSEDIEPEKLDGDHKRVLKAIDYDPTPVDMIIKRSELPAQEVSSILLILELNGEISSEPGGYYIRLTG